MSLEKVLTLFNTQSPFYWGFPQLVKYISVDTYFFGVNYTQSPFENVVHVVTDGRNRSTTVDAWFKFVVHNILEDTKDKVLHTFFPVMDPLDLGLDLPPSCVTTWDTPCNPNKRLVCFTAELIVKRSRECPLERWSSFQEWNFSTDTIFKKFLTCISWWSLLLLCLKWLWLPYLLTYSRPSGLPCCHHRFRSLIHSLGSVTTENVCFSEPVHAYLEVGNHRNRNSFRQFNPLLLFHGEWRY